MSEISVVGKTKVKSISHALLIKTFNLINQNRYEKNNYNNCIRIAKHFL